jgi:parallel beta-helix repeat protein
MKIQNSTIFAAFLGFVAVAASSYDVTANVIHVPGDQETIQGGLDVASYGDTVLVASGTFYENIIWPEVNGIRLLGAGRDSCIIDGGGLASVVRFESIDIIDTMTVFRGFTLTNGNASDPWPESQGGGAFIFASSPILEYLTITGNTAYNFGGGVYVWSSDNPIIRYCVISNNTAAAYGGLECFNSDVLVDHVTFGGNDPGGLYFETLDHPLVTNCIVAGNFDYGIRVSGTSFTPTRIAIGYTDINDPLQLLGYASVDDLGGIIDADPLFVDEDNGDYHLLSGSPCIDAGDPDYPHDPDGTITDMGAFYFSQTTDIDEPAAEPRNFMLLDNYPNPFNASTVIRYELPIGSPVTVEIYNALGQKIESLYEGMLQPGYHQATWNAVEFSSGTYFCRVEASGFSGTRKMLLIK